MRTDGSTPHPGPLPDRGGEGGTRAEVQRNIVSSARRNMRAHALLWRQAMQWHDRLDAAVRLNRAILWRDTANRIATMYAPQPAALAA